MEALAAYTEKQLSRRDFVRLAAAFGVTTLGAAELLATTAPVRADEPRTGGKLIEGYDRTLSVLDPIKSTWADPGLIAIYEPVIVRDLDGGLVPYLATAFKSGDTEWRLTIPKGRTFHSGAPLTPEAVQKALTLMITPNVGQNAVFYTAVSDIAVDGDDVVIHLKSPRQGLGEVLATEYAAVPNVAKRDEVGVGSFGAKEADGSGPFKLDDFDAGAHARVARFDGYKGGAPFFENKGPAHLDAIEWVPILEPSQRAPEIETGAVHCVKNPPYADVARLKGNDNLVVLEFPETSNFFLLPNMRRADLGFNDLRVRRAMSLMIDREGIVNAILRGGAEVTNGPASSGWRYFEPGVKKFNNYDPDGAAKLLDEAGWTLNGDTREKNGVELAFTAINLTDVIENQVMAAIADMFAEFGIKMQVQSLEGAAFREQRPKADLFGYKWLWSVPADVIPFFIGGYQPNDEPDAKEALAAFKEWEGARSDAELVAASSKAQLIVAEKLPIIPLYTPTTVWAHNKKVHGWRPNRFNLYPFYNDVWLES
jgi:peptide/nickel transport system substrate-binding protein